MPNRLPLSEVEVTDDPIEANARVDLILIEQGAATPAEPEETETT